MQTQSLNQFKPTTSDLSLDISRKLQYISSQLPPKAQKVKRILTSLAEECEVLESLVGSTTGFNAEENEDAFSFIEATDMADSDDDFDLVSCPSSFNGENDQEWSQSADDETASVEIQSITSSTSSASVQSTSSEHEPLCQGTSAPPSYASLSQGRSSDIIMQYKLELENTKRELDASKMRLTMLEKYVAPVDCQPDIEMGLSRREVKDPSWVSPIWMLDIRTTLPWTSKIVPTNSMDCVLSPVRMLVCYVALMHLFVLFLMTHKVF